MMWREEVREVCALDLVLGDGGEASQWFRAACAIYAADQ